MRHFSFSVAVGTSAGELFKFIPSDVHMVMVKAQGALEVGTDGVSVGSGVDLSAGESFGFTWRDFNPADPGYNMVQTMYAVAAADTSARVYGWRR